MNLKDFFSSCRDTFNEKERVRIIRRAHTLFQITEHQGKLWITYQGVRILPESMLCEDALSAVADLRLLYIKENIATDDDDETAECMK